MPSDHPERSISRYRDASLFLMILSVLLYLDAVVPRRSATGMTDPARGTDIDVSRHDFTAEEAIIWLAARVATSLTMSPVFRNVSRCLAGPSVACDWTRVSNSPLKARELSTVLTRRDRSRTRKS